MIHRCIIVDDERLARDKLRKMLALHADFRLIGEAADAEAAVRLIDEQQPDLCFLDVQMPEGSGFDILRRVRRVPCVIFTTAYDEYAVQAFDVGSVDYLLKPFGRTRFAEALERARRDLAETGPRSERLLRLLEQLETGDRGAAAPSPSGLRRIPARKGSRIVLLEPEAILGFEAEETLVFARTVDGRFLVERTLGELEGHLADGFFRAHRACLVNVARIGEIVPGEAGTYVLIMNDEARTRLPLSRRQARKLREKIPW